MNLFLDKSLSQLRAMAPSLSDPELDALCAAVCDGEWVRGWEHSPGDYTRYDPKDAFGHVWYGSIGHYTTDPREAMRLLVKYRLEIGQPAGDEWWVAHSLYCVCEGEEPLATHQDPCRAITEAAVVARITEMMEGE